MSSSRKAVLAFALGLVALAGLAGCTAPQQDSSIPWSRPADWEGRVPGLGN